ncbi:unnamed protein product [Ostreobium quekettii]|uniref:Uncharacterized protein n=1 Tax=Ostreobium quekettii TaxID=121088 RepID=A0A8S1JCB6_9CHLO|nr:unnamed protein product [Ostreobium quekettii]|eukprot:evm.model.scf_202.2 EVM.evm.TU.scf_202.2   scf_202:13278-14153(+)
MPLSGAHFALSAIPANPIPCPVTFTPLGLARGLPAHCLPRRGALRPPPRAGAGYGVSPRAATKDEVYQGVYGPWSIEPRDEAEVAVYRAGLSVAALCLALGTAAALVPEAWDAHLAAAGLLNPLCLAGGAAMGVSLIFIHIYATPLKRFLQALWGAGVAGSVYLMLTQPEPLPIYVAHNPGAVWLVGPFFAAVTGLAFKEGLCYGTLDAALLFFLTPAFLLGHLSGAASEGVERGLAVAMVLLCGVFAARKYSQPVKDDIGDKSVFDFQKLPPQEQEALLRKLEAAGRDAE